MEKLDEDNKKITSSTYSIILLATSLSQNHIVQQKVVRYVPDRPLATNHHDSRHASLIQADGSASLQDWPPILGAQIMNP